MTPKAHVNGTEHASNPRSRPMLLAAVSLAANLLLGAWLRWAPTPSPHSESLPIRTEPGKPAPAEPLPLPAAPPVSALPAARPFHWRDLESEDYPTYIANLRQVGCPPATVRDIIGAELTDLYSQRLQALVRPLEPRFWDLVAPWPEEFLEKPEIKTVVEQLEELGREKRDVEERLLADLPAAGSPPNAAAYWCADFLPAATIEQLTALEAGIQSERNQVRQRGGEAISAEDKAALVALDDKLANGRLELLGPEGLEEYLLRRSSGANLRNELNGFEPTDTELRALARQRQQHEQERTPAAQRDRQTRALLGEDRYAAYQRARDNQFAGILRVTDRFDLPVDSAVAVYEARQDAERELRRLRERSDLEPERLAAAAEAFRVATDQQVRGVLGEQVYRTYLRYGGRDWAARFAAPAR